MNLVICSIACDFARNKRAVAFRNPARYVRLLQISLISAFAVHMSACAYWWCVRSTCVVCGGSAGRHHSATCYDADTNPLYTGPKFTTSEFCPPVWRVASLYTRNITEWDLEEDIEIVTATLFDEYNFASFVCIMGMLGGGPALAPTTNDQIVFAACLALIGLGVVSTVIGALSAIITSMDSLESAKHTQLDSIKSYLRFRSVDPYLGSKIQVQLPSPE